MPLMEEFELYWAEVEFQDIEESKLRPVMIIDSNAYLVSCLSVTSNTSRPEDYVIKRWREAGLSRPSAIKLHQIIDLDPSMIDRRIGKLDAYDISIIRTLI